MSRLLVPSFGLWYILCVIYWRIVLCILPDSYLSKPVFVITFSFLLSILVGFIPITTELSFQRAFVFWPFFIIGYYLKRLDAIEQIRREIKLLATIVLLLTLVFCFLYMPVFYGSNAFSPENLWGEMSMRIIHIMIAIILCACILIISPTKMGVITNIGQYTLLIYLLHPPLLKILKVFSSKCGYTPDLFIAVLITAITVALLYNCRNFKIFKYMT